MFDAKGDLEALCRGENWVNRIEGERTMNRIVSVDGISGIPTNDFHIVRASDRFDSGFIVGLIVIVGLVVVFGLVVMLGLVGLDFVDSFSECRRFSDTGRGQFRENRWPK